MTKQFAMINVLKICTQLLTTANDGLFNKTTFIMSDI